MDLETPEVVQIILAIGALGATAMGIVEGFKSERILFIRINSPVRRIGFARIKTSMVCFEPLLRAAFGPDAWEILLSQYQASRKDVARKLREATRIGLNPETATVAATKLGWSQERLDALVEASKLAMEDPEVEPQENETAAKRKARLERQKELDHARYILGQYEMAIDARIEAACGLAESDYQSGMRNVAAYVALVIAVAAGLLLGSEDNPAEPFGLVPYAILAGLAAVPLAPIAKDVTKALQQATAILQRRS